MRYELSGTTMQTVSIDLDRGERLFSQTATMAWMSDTIRMDTHTGGGLFAGLKRAMAGGGLFITEFLAEDRGNIAFAPRFPGQIVVERLGVGQSLICRKETFLCAERTIELDIAFQQRFGAGVFGGDGFILQRVSGPGAAFLDLSGEVVQKTLAPGERLLVHAGHIGIMEPTIVCGWLPRCKCKVMIWLLVGCSRLSGLLMQSVQTAGPDGVREQGPIGFAGYDAYDCRRVVLVPGPTGFAITSFALTTS